GSGKEQKISITGSSGLSKEEVEKLRKEAELHADEDKKTRELAEARNRLDAGVFTAEKFIADNGEKMPAEAKTAAEAALKEAQEALKKTDASAEEFEKAATALQTAIMAAAQTVPQPTAGEQPQADAGPAPEEKKKSKDGKVVDGDFEVVDDGKK
ncbi:MAG: molecular chaperone DnaK, partial [Verrucomicrobiota bacterium]